jgi:hypothetical protein
MFQNVSMLKHFFIFAPMLIVDKSYNYSYLCNGINLA